VTVALAGWYPDPAGEDGSRYWDGAQWTTRVRPEVAEEAVEAELAGRLPARTGAETSPGGSRPPPPASFTAGPPPPSSAPPPPPWAAGSAPPTAMERDAVRRFLASATAHGLRPEALHAAMLGELEHWSQTGRAVLPPPPGSAPPAYRPMPAPATPLIPAAAPTVAPPIPTAPPVVGPRPVSAASRWWARRREAVSADLAVHGLAYLGVALLFTGVFGFVVFAFGEVGTSWRPVAELALPLVCFGAAAFLYRRGAPFVSAAMELTGGLVLPIVAVASLADGAGIPPDLSGWKLVLALVLISLMLAGAYAMVVHRRPTSPLRFLVAPMLWLAVASAGLALAPTIPGGRDTSHPFPIQWALVAVAVTVTLAWCRRRPDDSVARASVVAAIPAAALAELVTLLASPRVDWPVGPLLLAGLATLVSIELLAPRLSPLAVTALQTLVVTVTAVTLAPQLGPAWAGSAAAVGLLAMGEWQARRRPERVVLLALLIAALVPTTIALDRPWPTLAVGGVGMAWSALRRFRPLTGVPEAMPITGLFVFPVLIASAVVRLLPVDTALVVLAASVAVVGLGVRLTPARRDGVMTVWILTAGGAVATAVALDYPGRPWLGSAAGALIALAFVAVPRWPCLRVWTTAAAATIALAWAANGAQLSLGAAALTATALGTLLVAIAAARRAEVAGHVGLVGHLIASGGLVLAVADTVRRTGSDGPWTATSTAALGVFALGWAVTTGVGEVRGCSVRDLLVRLFTNDPFETREFSPVTESSGRQAGAGLPPALALISTALLVPALLSTTGVLDRSDPWLAVTAGGVTIVAALAARFLADARRQLAWVWSVLGVWLTVVVAVAASPGRWAAVAASAAVILVVVAVGRVLRRLSMDWLAWMASAAVVVQTAHALGLANGSLHLALFGWASAALIGALAVDDVRSGRRRPGEWVRQPELGPGAVLGCIVAPLALLPIYGRAPSTYGWWSLLAAAVAFVVALQLRRGQISAIAWALVAVAYAALAPWDPMLLPWTIVPAVAVLLAAAELANRFVPTPPPLPVPLRPDLPAPPIGGSARQPSLAPDLARWDLPPFLVAHAVAAVALVTALDHGWVPATWIATGALGLMVAARLRAWLWAAGGTLLILVGAGVAGPAWLTLALVVTATMATLAATRETDDPRLLLQVVGMLAAGGAWVSAGRWQAWTLEEAIVATSGASAVVLAVLAGTTRWAGLGRDWLNTWVGLPLAGIAAVSIALDNPDLPRSPARLAVAGAIAVLSLSVALLAAPTDLAWLREASAVVAVVAAGLVANAVEASPTDIVTVATAAAMGATAVAVALHALAPSSPWRRPALLLAGLATAVGLAVAIDQLPDRPLLVAALLALGVDLLAMGLVTRRAGWLMAAPAAFVAAWLVFASEALAGNAQWFTVPIGVTVLVMVGVARWDRRRAGADPADPMIVGLDVLAMAFVVGASLVQTVSVSPAYGLVAVGLGIGLVAFGVLSRVRRRLVFGAATVVVALVLMAVPPLAGLVPGIRGWVPWALLVGVGMIAILAAAFLEQGRRAVHRAVRRFAELTEGWE